MVVQGGKPCLCMPPSWMEVHCTLILRNHSKAKKSSKTNNDCSCGGSEYLLILSYLEIYPTYGIDDGKELKWGNNI